MAAKFYPGLEVNSLSFIVVVGITTIITITAIITINISAAVMFVDVTVRITASNGIVKMISTDDDTSNLIMIAGGSRITLIIAISVINVDLISLWVGTAC